MSASGVLAVPSESTPTPGMDESPQPVKVYSRDPLSPVEKQKFADKWAEMTGGTVNEGMRLAETLPPPIGRKFLTIPPGSSYTVDQIKSLFVDSSVGLTPEIIEKLVDGPAIRISASNVAQIFLMFAIFSHLASNDVKLQLKDLLENRKDRAFEAANHAFKGAFTQFIVSMVAAGVTMGMGAVYAKQSLWPASKAGPKGETLSASRPSDWFGPIGTTQVTQPMNAGGEFANATGQLESSRDTALKEEADSLFGMMQELLRDLQSLGRGPNA